MHDDEAAGAMEMLRTADPASRDSGGGGGGGGDDDAGGGGSGGGAGGGSLLCRLLRACAPRLCCVCCRASPWTALDTFESDADGPPRARRRSSRWKSPGSSQFERYSNRAPNKYEHALVAEDGDDDAAAAAAAAGGVANPLHSPRAARLHASLDTVALGRVRDDGSRRLCLRRKVDVFVYAATNEDKRGIESDAVRENRDHLRLLRKVAGDDWASLDARSIDTILGGDEPADTGPPKRAFRWNNARPPTPTRPKTAAETAAPPPLPAPPRAPDAAPPADLI